MVYLQRNKVGKYNYYYLCQCVRENGKPRRKNLICLSKYKSIAKERFKEIVMGNEQLQKEIGGMK